jgi:hypothetical protein
MLQRLRFEKWIQIKKKKKKKEEEEEEEERLGSQAFCGT